MLDRPGYTLPVFAAASAKAALLYLLDDRSRESIDLDLLPETATIPIEQVAKLDDRSALAITRSDPGANLDLTRNTPVWAFVRLLDRQRQSLIIEGGEGIGKTATNRPAIYRYARELFDRNVQSLIPENQTLIVRLILPEGKQLAKRTSNEAFGILEGLSLIGTSGISQPHSALESLQEAKQELHQKIKTHPNLIFCIGSSGKQVIVRLNLPQETVVQTGNWIGALLVEAGLLEARSILLAGYHGKLIKLAGKIFNTSSHIADAKLEILASTVLGLTDNLNVIRTVLNCATAEEAYQFLRKSGIADEVFSKLADRIARNAIDYVKKYADTSVQIGTILFDRRGTIIARNETAKNLIAETRSKNN
ncbi:MAG: cobalt-precorrin-5B (C(1))-methyltransferase [Cyanobacteria bacterium SID2]|nr:cobalt-precorrin-5B (C(1))-methyltransferase [Cyanobacteria bacterium SID2]MBP0004758.1 cobalt-precorrin-5B (C(1))-methyltransferase [Cyanobacteria bacterium SBC]